MGTGCPRIGAEPRPFSPSGQCLDAGDGGPHGSTGKLTPIADFAVDTSPAPSREIGQHRFNQITPFLVAALAGQVIVPLGAIWLSDAFAFDIPAWWKWLIFGGTLPLSLVPVLIYRAVRAR